MGQWLWYSVRRAGLDRDLAEAAMYMRGRVLEIGGGRSERRGYFHPPVEQCGSWMYVDRSPARCPHVVGDVQGLPYAARSFDTVVCLEVLEYVPDPDRALKEIMRVLMPSGHLILSSPFLHRADTLQDYWRFTEHGLRLLLQSAGFEVLWVRGQGGALGVATNILKYAIYAQPFGWRRSCLGYVARPLLSLLWRLDGPTMRQQSTLATFSTGYVVVARPRP